MPPSEVEDSEVEEVYPVAGDWSIEETRKALWCSVTGIVQRQSYFAFVLQQTRLHVVEHGAGVPVAFCSMSESGTFNIFVNRRFFCSLTPSHQMFILRHEVGHLIQSYFSRAKGHDAIIITQYMRGGPDGKPETVTETVALFNIAADLCVNYEIQEEAKEMGINQDSYVWDQAVFPKRFDFDEGLTIEEYYRLLLDKYKDLDDASAGLELEWRDGVEGWGRGQNIDLDSLTEHQREELEKHLEGGDSLAKSDPRAVRDIVERAFSEWKKKGRGTVPGSIEALIDRTLKPSAYPFEQTLSRFLGRHLSAKKKRTWMRPSRRIPGRARGRYNPRDKSVFWLIVDTSGSMSDEALSLILKHIVRIVEKTDSSCRVCEIDTRVQAEYPFTGKIDEKHYRARGRGGTTLQPALDYINKEKGDWSRPSCAVIFTDGYFEPDLQDPGYPVLFAGPSEECLRSHVSWGERLDVEGIE